MLIADHDHTAQMFRFSPLGGKTFQSAVPESARAGLPDTIVVLTADGLILTQSSAVLHILRRLGGWWAWVATVSRLVPGVMRDWIYDLIARNRVQVGGSFTRECSAFPDHLRGRIDL